MQPAKIEIRTSPIQGNGVFATNFIPKGELIHTMSGREVSWLKCLFLILTKQVHIDMPFQISAKSYILLDKLAISINHSCEPCCAVSGQTSIIARRDIAAGEEISYDYSTTVLPSIFTKNWLMECRCGQPNCRKLVKNADFIPDLQLKNYIAEQHLPEFIRDYVRIARPDLFK